VQRRINRHVGKLFPELHTLYADYENYLRNELREWAENIMFDGRTMERKIFNLPLLRSLVSRHLSGLEYHTIGKIAPLITYEMMLRRYYDQSN
jgi:asparagine synthase (glutamine-hydrolysing)